MSKKSALPKYQLEDAELGFIKSPVNKLISSLRIDIKYKNETQKLLGQAIRENDVVICSGPAGTGKTLISVHDALMLIKNNPTIYKEIKLVKSVTQLRNEDLGILPGDEKDKLKFQMMSFIDAFNKLVGDSNTNKLIDEGLIKMEVFGSIRGRSFSNAIIIVDEFQNINHDNAKTFLTRFGENTKVIVLGDSSQIDLKNKKDSSLDFVVKMVKEHPIEGVAVVEFSEEDIVRHRLTSYFMNLFKTPEKPTLVKPLPPKSQTILEPEGFSFFKWLKKIFK